MYARTIQHLHIHFPSDILVADNNSSGTNSAYHVKSESNNNKLVDAIEKEFGLKCSYLSRSIWNPENGTLGIEGSANAQDWNQSNATVWTTLRRRRS